MHWLAEGGLPCNAGELCHCCRHCLQLQDALAVVSKVNQDLNGSQGVDSKTAFNVPSDLYLSKANADLAGKQALPPPFPVLSISQCLPLPSPLAGVLIRT